MRARSDGRWPRSAARPCSARRRRTGDSATVANLSTGDFTASPAGDAAVNARVSLPRPRVAPLVFAAGPGIWLAATGS